MLREVWLLYDEFFFIFYFLVSLFVYSYLERERERGFYVYERWQQLQLPEFLRWWSYMYVVAPHSSQFVYMSVDIAIKEQQYFFSIDVFLKRENVVLYIYFHSQCLIE